MRRIRPVKPPRSKAFGLSMVKSQRGPSSMGHDFHALSVLEAMRGQPELLVLQPTTCLEYTKSMTEIRAECEDNGWVPMFHYTQPLFLELISKTGLRMSTRSEVGSGGIYFSVQSPASYHLGTSEYEGSVIMDCWGSEKLKELSGKHKVDLVLVCGIEPNILTMAPGGRNNSRMVSRHTFEAMSLPRENGDFFLRPDRILGAFLLDPTDPPTRVAMAEDALAEEIIRDQAIKDKLAEAALEQEANLKDIHQILSFESTLASTAEPTTRELQKATKRQQKIKRSGSRVYTQREMDALLAGVVVAGSDGDDGSTGWTASGRDAETAEKAPLDPTSLQEKVRTIKRRQSMKKGKSHSGPRVSMRAGTDDEEAEQLSFEDALVAKGYSRAEVRFAMEVVGGDRERAEEVLQEQDPMIDMDLLAAPSGVGDGRGGALEEGLQNRGGGKQMMTAEEREWLKSEAREIESVSL